MLFRMLLWPWKRLHFLEIPVFQKRHNKEDRIWEFIFAEISYLQSHSLHVPFQWNTMHFQKKSCSKSNLLIFSAAGTLAQKVDTKDYDGIWRAIPENFSPARIM